MKNATILIVDDDPLSIKAIHHHLKNAFSIMVAADGEQALQLASGSRPPDLILLDIVMPKMGGFEVCAHLKADPRTAAIPVIFITGLSDGASEQKGLELGAVDFISKPCSAARLRARVRTHLELKRHREKLEQMVVAEVNKNREKDMLMVHQNRLASIGQLAAGMAHEINNPIGFIRSNLNTFQTYSSRLQKYISLLEEAVALNCPVEVRTGLEMVSTSLDLPYIADDIFSLIAESQDGAERITAIVHDLKDFASIDDTTMEESDLNLCLESSINIARGKINSVAELELSLGEIPPVQCNPRLLKQVISNLLENAIQAITSFGRISIRTEYNGTCAVLTVSDTGHGMDANVIAHIYEPFFTTNDVGKGTGLGLSICYDIIKKYGGEIGVTSEVGVGTSFMVQLPA